MTIERELETTELRPVAAEVARPVRVPSSPDNFSQEALYGVAMLRIALDLKRHPGTDLETVLAKVISTMRLEDSPFRQYLARNGGLLRSSASKKL